MVRFLVHDVVLPISGDAVADFILPIRGYQIHTVPIEGTFGAPSRVHTLLFNEHVSLGEIECTL